jgi:hypothetical protein
MIVHRLPDGIGHGLMLVGATHDVMPFVVTDIPPIRRVILIDVEDTLA